MSSGNAFIINEFCNINIFKRTMPAFFNLKSVSVQLLLVGFFASGHSLAQTAKVSEPKLPPARSSSSNAAPVDSIENPRILVVPSRETVLVAQMNGRINKMISQMGAGFKQGQTVVEFDCSEQNARLRMAQAEFVSAKDNFDAKLRLKALEAAGEAEVQQAASATEKAKGQIELVASQLKLCRVAAPFSGQLVKQHVKEFQSVNVGQPLIDIVASGALKVRLNVPSKWLQWIKIGESFSITVDENNKTYGAKVVALNGRVDAVSQSIELEGVILKPDSTLLVGMSGSAQFARGK
jgi:membrane fusion protein (multidrug efflux system)